MWFEKRLRLFAGPNGSGKSTVIKGILNSGYDCGVYLNADELEKILLKNGYIDLRMFDLDNIEEGEFNEFCSQHTLPQKAQALGYKIDLSINDSKVYYNTNGSTNSLSYEASLIINFTILKLLSRNRKVSFESVMSHNSKIELLKHSKELGYKNYLYYICTDNPKINCERVEARVKKGGHNVIEEKIHSRYYSSLDLLSDAIKYSYKAYIFDNSGEQAVLILSIDSKKDSNNAEFPNLSKSIPDWVQTYIIDKLS